MAVEGIPEELRALLSTEQLAELDSPAAGALQDRVEAQYRDLAAVCQHANQLRIQGELAQFFAHANTLLAMLTSMDHDELALIANFALVDASRFADACERAGLGPQAVL